MERGPSAEPAAQAWQAPAPRTERLVAPGLVVASVGRRFVAWVLDIVVLSIIAVAAVIVVAILAAALIGGARPDEPTMNALVGIGVIGLSALYFIGSWRTPARATPAMRLLKLQVANQADGRPLDLVQGTKRWILLGYPISGLVYVVPAIAGLVSLVTFALPIVLLVTALSHPMRQGLHDRWARSLVVQPAGLESNGVVLACLVVVLLLVLLPFIAIAGLIFLGSQISGLETTSVVVR
jgi:uncharacterized RDD family membrane protein YckC